jgi:hypothetical protein
MMEFEKSREVDRLDTILIAWSSFFLRCSVEFGAQEGDETIGTPLTLPKIRNVVTHFMFFFDVGWRVFLGAK